MPKDNTSPSKSKKAISTHPKYEEMIRDAIIALKERKGSSRHAIKKYILNTFKLPDNSTTNTSVRLAINKGVEKGLFTFVSGPSGTIKLVKKEPVKKEKKVVEKKEKPKKIEKKEKPKKADKKEIKPKAKKTATKKVIPKKAAPAKKATKSKKTSTSSKKPKPMIKRVGERKAPKRRATSG